PPGLIISRSLGADLAMLTSICSSPELLPLFNTRRKTISAIGRCVSILLLSMLPRAGPSARQSRRVADFNDPPSIGAKGTTTVQERVPALFIGEWSRIHRT